MCIRGRLWCIRSGSAWAPFSMLNKLGAILVNRRFPGQNLDDYEGLESTNRLGESLSHEMPK